MIKVITEGDFGKARLERNRKVAQAWLTNEVARDSEPYVPFAASTSKHKGGTLNASVLVDIDEGKVEWNTPYARAQYYGKPNKNKSKHPKATMRWFEAAKGVKLNTWIRGVKKIGGVE